MSYIIIIIIIINAFREKCVKAFYPLSLITHIKKFSKLISVHFSIKN